MVSESATTRGRVKRAMLLPTVSSRLNDERSIECLYIRMQERAFTQTKLIAHARLKNDRVDANRLAYLLRADLLPKVSSDGVYDTAAFGRPDGLQAECTGGRDACH